MRLGSLLVLMLLSTSFLLSDAQADTYPLSYRYAPLYGSNCQPIEYAGYIFHTDDEAESTCAMDWDTRSGWEWMGDWQFSTGQSKTWPTSANNQLMQWWTKRSPAGTPSWSPGGYLGRQLLCPYGGTLSGSQCIDAPPCGEGLTRDAAGQCSPKELQCPADGNPIQPALANKFQIETDYTSAGETSLSFRRTYNSVSVLVAAMGPQWRHNFDRTVRLRSAQVPAVANVFRPDGRVLRFTENGGAWLADPDVNDRLTRLTNSAGLPTGWDYRVAADESTERYDAAGTLLTISDRAGRILRLSYSDGFGGVYPTTAPSCSAPGPARGQLWCITDSFGRKLRFTYDGSSRISKVFDPDGKQYVYAYSANGYLATVAYPDNTIRTYHYNELTYTNGSHLPYALTGITDEGASRFATFKYDATGRAISSEHAGGAGKVSLSYGAGVTQVTDALNTTRTRSFQTILGVARQTSTDQPCSTGCGGNSPAATAYDANGNAVWKTDFNGNSTCYVYDLIRNVPTVRIEGLAPGLSCPADPSTYTPTPGTRERKIATQWHATYRLPTQIDEPGRRTTLTHDANGNVLTKTILDTATSASRTWANTYNAFGQVLTADGPRTDVADVTTYTYYNCTTGYECGQVHTITNSAGHVTTNTSYNAHGQPLTMTDPNGVVTTLTYDLRQRLTSRTVGTEVTTFDYWPTGLLKKATVPDGSYLEYTYDAAHRLTDINDADGNRIHYTLDLMGNRTGEQAYDPSNALVRTRTRVFDTLSRLQKEIGAAGTANVTTTFGYDNNGNQTSINAPLSRNTGQTYDELNLLTQVTDPLTGTTQYGYNALDQLISVTDPRSKVTSYAYNALGDLTQQVSPDTGTTTNTYDSGGNLQTSTDARSKTATYAYDALNRVASVSYPDQTISYTYDSGTNQKGRLTQVSDASGSTSWSYDPQGRVLSRQQNMGAVTKGLGYGYDAAGRLQTLTLPSGNTITYGYTNSKVTSLTLNGSTTILSNVLYQPFGPTLGWTWGNSTLAVREYDMDGKITDIDSAGMKSYGYDDAFRITGITDANTANLSQSYGYDLLDRLTSAAGTSLNQSWTYDANGNRLTQDGAQPSTYTVSSSNNRISSVTGSLSRTYSYDARGNITGDGTATFTYDDAGRMVSATKAGVTTTYKLNALGQRVRKIANSTSTYFVYDESGHLLGEYDDSGNLVQETVWFDDTPVAVLKANGSGGVSVFYVHTDHLNTPRRISRPSDNVIVWRWDSDPFGTTAANEDPDGDSNLFAYGLRFPGQYYDAETELHYNYYRDYDPSTGRYVQSDPIGLEGGLNTYAYVGGNPLSLVDPLGLRGDVADWVAGGTRTCVSVVARLGGGVALFLTPGFNPRGECSSRRPPPGSDCPGSPGDKCFERLEQEIQRCSRYRGRHTRDDPDRWYRACETRAWDRYGPMPEEQWRARSRGAWRVQRC